MKTFNGWTLLLTQKEERLLWLEDSGPAHGKVLLFVARICKAPADNRRHPRRKKSFLQGHVRNLAAGTSIYDRFHKYSFFEIIKRATLFLSPEGFF